MKKKFAAFSLLETVVTLAIFGILLTMLSNVLLLNLRVARKISQRAQMRDEISEITGLLQRDLRNADRIYLDECETTLGNGVNLSSCRMDVAGIGYVWTDSNTNTICAAAREESEANVICKLELQSNQPAEVVYKSDEVLTLSNLRFEANLDAQGQKGQIYATLVIASTNKSWEVSNQVRQISVTTRNF